VTNEWKRAELLGRRFSLPVDVVALKCNEEGQEHGLEDQGLYKDTFRLTELMVVI